jgi:uncharacterized protein YlxP (DUF503 family)
MLIAACLIELSLSESDSIKDKRRVARAVKDRLRRRFNVSAAEVDDQDDRHSVCIGCVMVGIDPRHLRAQMAKAIEYVEGLGLAEVVSDDIEVLRLDQIEEIDDGDDDEGPEPWIEE